MYINNTATYLKCGLQLIALTLILKLGPRNTCTTIFSYYKLMVKNYDLFVFRYWLFNQNEQHRIIQYTLLFNCICYICYVWQYHIITFENEPKTATFLTQSWKVTVSASFAFCIFKNKNRHDILQLLGVVYFT